jgi:hypothetical protein
MSSLYIARSTEIAARVLGGEMMIMSARDSTLFNLNDVGTAIWQAADGVTPLEQIVERKICAEFDVERAEALRDAESFVKELAQHGILLVSDQPIANTPPQTSGDALPRGESRGERGRGEGGKESL